jgi:glycosyltransferase involved in cell wall biosynthesis
MLVQFQPPDLAIPIESTPRTIRVLHVVENLDNQAVENWLLRVLRASKDHPHIHWTFFCTLGKSGRQDDAALALGADVIHSSFEIGDKVRFMAGLREVMKRGNYDVLHCHHDIMSAVYLLASIGLPFKKRIVHLHNTSMSLPTPSRVKSELAREPMRQICLRMADQIVGISKQSLESLIRGGISESTSQRVVHYAIDTNRFKQAEVDPVEFRHRMGLEPSASVLMFVGRMVEYKNPRFLLEMLDNLAKSDERPVAVFAGTGNQEAEILKLARLKSLEHRIRLLGFRDDVPELMMASDILIWPSCEEPMEGLGLGIVEAQAAGLPILMSRSVPEEAIVVPELVTVLPLAAGPEAWARTTVEILNRRRPTPAASLARIEASSFSMSAGVSNLMALYHGVEN